MDPYDNECNEVSAQYFNRLFDEKYFDQCNFGIFHLNIRSINSNFNTLLVKLQTLSYKFSVIVLTETWLADSTFDSYTIPRYNIYNKSSIGRRGGIRVYVRDYISASEISIPHGNSFQSLNLKLSIANHSNIILSSIYISPSNSKVTFNEEFSEAFDGIFQPSAKLIFIGDFNLNMFHSHDPQVNNYINFMHSMLLVPLITLPTRNPPDSNQCSLIDHIWTNVSPPTSSYVFDFCITDHSPIATVFQLITDQKLIPLKFRDFSNENINSFLNEAEAIAQTFTYNEDEDLNALHNSFKNWLEDILNRYFLIRRKYVGKKRMSTPWITKAILRCIDKKHRLYKLFKNGLIDRHYFTTYKNKLTRVLRMSKQFYFHNSFIKAKNDIKSTWSIINKTLNRRKMTTVDSLTINNEEITDKSEICRTFNSYFVSIVNNLDNNFGNANHMLDILPSIRNSALFTNSDHIEMYNAIWSLKNCNNLAMPTKFLKLFSPFISPILSDLFTMCLNRGAYPDVLKEANVTPVFKSGDRGEPGNYRPISVLSDVNKVYEEMILSRLNNFIEHNSIISECQYGFWANTLTQEACIDLLSILLTAYTKNNYAIVLFIDFKKAFDTVNHERLLKKLSCYGIRGIIHDLFSSYLTNRKQKVAFQGESSDYLPIVSGVPHGSKLGPVLFNLYVNDISCLNFYNNSTFQFADDTSFVSSDNDLPTLVERFNNNMSLFFTWC